MPWCHSPLLPEILAFYLQTDAKWMAPPQNSKACHLCQFLTLISLTGSQYLDQWQCGPHWSSCVKGTIVSFSSLKSVCGIDKTLGALEFRAKSAAKVRLRAQESFVWNPLACFPQSICDKVIWRIQIKRERFVRFLLLIQQKISKA